ncbi:MAG: transporter ATP-binding protein [Acidimicrobiales bacterium]|nr:transporter ATP-binding protein [Acidimicrobiales bacterium]
MVAVVVLAGWRAVPLLAAALAGTWVCLRAISRLGAAGQAAGAALAAADAWWRPLENGDARAELASCGMVESTRRRWRREVAAANRALALGDRQAALLWFVGQAVVSLGAALTLGLALQHQGDSIEGWMTIALAALIVQAQRQVASFATTVGWLGGALASASSFAALVDAEPGLDATDPTTDGSVELERVSFEHRDGTAALHAVSAVARPGSVVAIVGPNGSGKSTLASVLLGLYTPTAGSVTRPDGPASATFQDFARFSFSVDESVRLGRQGAEVGRALALAELSDLVRTLPEAGATRITDSALVEGSGLSAGQWQRVALARALTALADTAPVLVLDEATRYMDEELAMAFMSTATGAWRASCPRGAFFFITHRPEELRYADEIWVLDRGRLTITASPP